MFLVVGKGAFMRENLIEQLVEWGSENISEVMRTVEKTGFVQYGKYRILLVK
jgi:hypothetical protein